MIRPRLSCLLLAAAGILPAAHAESVNELTLQMEGNAEYPRNSEGAFATLKSGRVVFYYSQFAGGSSDFSPARLVEIDSDDQGRTWSTPKARFTNEPGTLEMSASLLRLQSGKLALFSLIKHGTLDCRPYMRLSDDDGATWSKPRSLLKAPGYFILNDDRVIQLKSGRLVMPIGFHRERSQDQNWGQGVDHRALDLWYYSDDEGMTWTESPTWWTIPVASATGLQEPGIVELADGSLYSWARTDAGYQFGFRSTDKGETWSPPVPTTLFSPPSPASIKRLPNSSDLLAVYNDHSGQFPFAFVPETYSGRTPVVAALSSDGGKTWTTLKLIENDPNRDYCYIAIHYVGDSVLLSYMSNSRDHSSPSEMTIRRINLAWLTAPEDALATKARAVLHPILEQQESWQKIHAAEALIAAGETIQIRERFLKLVPNVNSLVYRVGVWRVLAETSPTQSARNLCVAQVEKIFCDLKAPDRSQAIETLDKLRVRVGGDVLEAVRRTATDGPEKLKPLAYWSLRLVDEPGALDSLKKLLISPDPVMRTDAAYAFRLLKEQDPSALAALAQAANTEPANTSSYPYLLSAAFALKADSAHLAEWRTKLEALLVHGTDDARWEACQALLPSVTPADFPKYTALLDDPGTDSRVGAALTILYTDVRH